MSIRSMGVRSAYRMAQDAGVAKDGHVVTSVGAALVPEADVADRAEDADRPPPSPAPMNTDAPANGAQPHVVTRTQTPPNPVSQYLDSVTTWIPTETIGLFVAFAGFFAVFDDFTKEMVLGGVVALLTVIYAAASSIGAQKQIPDGPAQGRRRTAVTTSLLALIAFAAWWGALPGSFATDSEELGLDPFFPAIALAAVALVLPLVARILKVEPGSSTK